MPVEVSVLSTLSPIAPSISPAEPALRRSMPAPPEPLPQVGWLGFTWGAWAVVGTVAVLFGAVYRFNLVRLWLKTNPFNGEDNWGHAIAVPLIGLYYLYLHRDELQKVAVKPLLGLDFYRGRFLAAAAAIVLGGLGYMLLGRSEASLATYFESIAAAVGVLGILALMVDWGLACLLGGLMLSVYGIHPGKNDFVWDVGMIITLFGAVLTLGGWGIMRIAAFPIVFLLCALPWPGLLYSKLAMPLQQLAAQVAVFTLQVCGIESNYAGTKIFIQAIGPNGPMMRTLNVAEACAGLRSLMTFVSLGAAMAFLSDRPLWQKLLITFSAVPIAILCNVIRVSGQGLLDRVNPELSQDFAHQFVGLVMLLPAFFMLLGIVWVLDHLFVEDHAPKKELA